MKPTKLQNKDLEAVSKTRVRYKQLIHRTSKEVLKKSSISATIVAITLQNFYRNPVLFHYHNTKPHLHFELNIISR